MSLYGAKSALQFGSEQELKCSRDAGTKKEERAWSLEMGRDVSSMFFYGCVIQVSQSITLAPIGYGVAPHSFHRNSLRVCCQQVCSFSSFFFFFYGHYTIPDIIPVKRTMCCGDNGHSTNSSWHLGTSRGK